MEQHTVPTDLLATVLDQFDAVKESGGACESDTGADHDATDHLYASCWLDMPVDPLDANSPSLSYSQGQLDDMMHLPSSIRHVQDSVPLCQKPPVQHISNDTHGDAPSYSWEECLQTIEDFDWSVSLDASAHKSAGIPSLVGKDVSDNHEEDSGDVMPAWGRVSLKPSTVSYDRIESDGVAQVNPVESLSISADSIMPPSQPRHQVDAQDSVELSEVDKDALDANEDLSLTEQSEPSSMSVPETTLMDAPKEELIEEPGKHQCSIRENHSDIPGLEEKKPAQISTTKTHAAQESTPKVKDDGMIQCEDTGHQDTRAALFREKELLEAPDLNYDMQEHLTDVQDTPSLSYEHSSASYRPPRNHVSNRELAGLGSDLAPGMYVGQHQPIKRASLKTSPSYDELNDSELEVQNVKKTDKCASTASTVKTLAAKKSNPGPTTAKKRAKASCETVDNDDDEEDDVDELSHAPAVARKTSGPKRCAPQTTTLKKRPKNMIESEDDADELDFSPEHKMTDGDNDTGTHALQALPATMPASAPGPIALSLSLSTKRKSLLKSTPSRPSTPAASPATRNRFGFSQRRPRSKDGSTATATHTPAKPKGTKGNKADGAEGASEPPKRRGAVSDASSTPVTRRASLQAEKDSNVARRLRSSD
ncbi:hypothetical protein ACEQ8H_003285 [Pleosporales sp. CAS-2024a]